MSTLRTIARVVGATLAFALYVWFAAVRAVPFVKRRKAVRRRRR
jgi:hypothetical protein